ncbi:hypothetical protein L6164_002916 [Bauhinia variegata]|uniref:Uncharacterized protein n=1 Tax=Bauhinia variegata TaxID=167791 RepID=A0ACB9Q0A1_BAUVA|nr:hypothetical protein L6164_002916 [Bauhinia variegata]
MLENPPPSILSAPADSPAVVKRYAPPNQRNRSNNRRKSSDRLDRTNSLGNDLEKNQVFSSRNVPVADRRDASSSNRLNENHYSGIITLEGCSSSAAYRLLNDRWTAVMRSYDDPIDSSEKPVMYMGGTSAWGQFRPPHQIMASTASTSSSMDFLGELRRAMHSASSGFNS